VKTDESCVVGCAAGYSGKDAFYKCSPNGSLLGDKPHCEAQTCNGSTTGASMFTAHSITSDCNGTRTGQDCSASCNQGYEGATQIYKCTGEGFQGTAMECTAQPCDASHDVENGDGGDCTSSLASGRSCTITCNEGYTRDGATYCLAGTLRSIATCKPNPCNAAEGPKWGSAGDCNDYLQSGQTCQPRCNDGYSVSGTSSCNAGVLTAATCKAHLQCELIYEKSCKNRYGFWSDDPDHLDYPGCEHFCNSMYVTHGKTVLACELAEVTSGERASKGKWCFAHEMECHINDAEDNAAAECVPLTDQN
jgi:hypothetical protein